MPAKNSSPDKILVIVGPTSSGKSELAVTLARRFHGEIISCDSRQIYKGMNLGTGKVEGIWKNGSFIYKNIPHHLIDFVSPKQQYSAALFQAEAQKKITAILKRRKLPILCGGTAHWIDAVVFDLQIPDVKPNMKLRSKLEKKPAPDLYMQLKKLDPRRAATVDRHNKRRLIRALEIIISTGKPVPSISHQPSTLTPLWIGISPAQPILFAKIKKRLKQRFTAGMLKEVSELHKQGLSWKKLESFGLEYKFVSLHLQKKISSDAMFEQLFLAIQHYSKRQMTWWKRNKNIRWIINYRRAEKLVDKFIK